MPRPRGSFKVPSYRLHKASGRGIVTLAGRTHYCPGPYKSKESMEDYKRVVGEFMARGGIAPPTKHGATVAELIAGYLTHRTAKSPRFAKGKRGATMPAMRVLNEMYGSTLARDFSPVNLRAVQEAMVGRRKERQERPPSYIVCHPNRKHKYAYARVNGQRRYLGVAHTPESKAKYQEVLAEWRRARDGQDGRWCRNFINQCIYEIRRAFRWAESRDIVPGSTVHALRTVEPLAPGDFGVRDTGEVQPVNPKHVEAVEKFLPQIIRDINEVREQTGMRPSEILIMRTADIDTTGHVWRYVPTHHKMAYRGQSRIVPLPPRAAEIIEQYMKPDLGAYLFTTLDLWRSYLAMSERPSPRRKDPSQYRRRMSDRIRVETYWAWIDRACKRAGVPHWFPYQLRHAAGHRFREIGGLELVQVMLGHKHRATSERYAKPSVEAAEEIIAKIG